MCVKFLFLFSIIVCIHGNICCQGIRFFFYIMYTLGCMKINLEHTVACKLELALKT